MINYLIIFPVMKNPRSMACMYLTYLVYFKTYNYNRLNFDNNKDLSLNNKFAFKINKTKIKFVSLPEP